MLLSHLASELICRIFAYANSPQDYMALGRTSRRLQVLGNAPACHLAFLYNYFDADRPIYKRDYPRLVQWIASTGVEPIGHTMTKTARRIPTQLFVNVFQNPRWADINPLVLFRSECVSGQYTVPSVLDDHTLPLVRARQASRHRLIENNEIRGVRRVYLDAEVRMDRNQKIVCDCVFHQIDAVYCFTVLRDVREVHVGRILYQDEGIVSDTTWSSLLSVCHRHTTSIQVMPTPKRHRRQWTPCLLQSLEGCTLQRRISKGGLSAGCRFDYVFVYEHVLDDTICLEFCARTPQGDLEPRGFVLMKEFCIVWKS
ncbi:hypothetical protein BCR43DRAFT_524805 [Syncephalastrum racemosum]|uniref:F-box domain-containing protein n=1 Tax=Syncephalastrum racemosum TaxID=13706 RepID=A0A1X2HD99_SYNRA|nr:hypothetical protein BCR43DRAFT_524805 [Syncephalastrum racemosum]